MLAHFECALLQRFVLTRCCDVQSESDSTQTDVFSASWHAWCAYASYFLKLLALACSRNMINYHFDWSIEYACSNAAVGRMNAQFRSHLGLYQAGVQLTKDIELSHTPSNEMAVL
jgi:hypothetical protein